MQTETNNEAKTSKEIAVIEKVEQIASEQLSTEELVVLRRVISMIRGLDSLGSLANFIKNVVIWCGVIFGAYIAVKNNFIAFILEHTVGR